MNVRNITCLINSKMSNWKWGRWKFVWVKRNNIDYKLVLGRAKLTLALCKNKVKLGKWIWFLNRSLKYDHFVLRNVCSKFRQFSLEQTCPGKRGIRRAYGVDQLPWRSSYMWTLQSGVSRTTRTRNLKIPKNSDTQTPLYELCWPNHSARPAGCAIRIWQLDSNSKNTRCSIEPNVDVGTRNRIAILATIIYMYTCQMSSNPVQWSCLNKWCDYITLYIVNVQYIYMCRPNRLYMTPHISAGVVDFALRC